MIGVNGVIRKERLSGVISLFILEEGENEVYFTSFPKKKELLYEI